MREWYFSGICEITAPSSERSPPKVVPWPHIVSNTGVTVSIAANALVNDLASREIADSTVL